MTSIFSGGNVSGVESALEGLVPQFSGYAQQAAALEPNFLDAATTFQQQGQGQIYPLALGQYEAGATGQLTPSEQAAVAQTKQQMDTSTRGTYGNLGLGGSTMEGQDLGSNDLKSLAQQHAFNVSDETLGLSGLSQALGYENAGVGALSGALSTLTGAGNILGGASGALNSAGTLAAGQQAAQMQALSGIGSALGSKF